MAIKGTHNGHRDDESYGFPNLNQYETLQDKWNDIQEQYLSKYPKLEVKELYYVSGGFAGLLEKISEILGKTVEEIRSEIKNWEVKNN